jgi:hypothetical protein
VITTRSGSLGEVVGEDGLLVDPTHARASLKDVPVGARPIPKAGEPTTEDIRRTPFEHSADTIDRDMDISKR